MSTPATATPVPAWLREIDLALRAHPQVLLTGNVHDRYRLPDPHLDGQVWHMGLDRALWSIAGPAGYGALLSYTTNVGVRLVGPRGQGWPPAATAVLDRAGVEAGNHLALDKLRDLVAAVVDVEQQRGTSPPVGLILADAPRLLSSAEQLSEEERRLLAMADLLAYAARPVGECYNTVFWVLDGTHDLPAWFATGNRALRVTAIPAPDLAERERTASDIVPGLPGAPPEPTELVRRLAEASHGMLIRGMLDVAELAGKKGVPAAKIEDAVRAYRVGETDDRWRDPALRERVRNAEKVLADRVKGQPDAVRRAMYIVARSVTGLAGAHTKGGRNKPRGVLFFAGPTGVGKTELAKALAELLFGDENAYLRFDMSEFAAEHNEARLIGAPPGYVGFDAGGELTNGIREQPFRVVLFDEIEKAHPRLLDKFLQILDDGRLTDGRGATVYFTEALIVFTTNLGTVRPQRQEGETTLPATVVTPDDSREVIEKQLRTNIEAHFREELQRPELYNRLRDGIVIFDFLRDPVPDQIADAAIDRVRRSVLESHGINLYLAETAQQTLRKLATSDRHNGGRGIVSGIQTYLLDPLAWELFENPRDHGSTLHVRAVEQAGQNWQLVVE